MSDTPRTDAEWQAECCSSAPWYRIAERMKNHAADLELQLAEVTKDRDEWKERYERLNESLAKNKRLFSSALSEKVINEQLQRIRQLESLYSEMQKQYHELKETNK